MWQWCGCFQDKCPYPCTCPTDGYCEGCEECPRQLGEPCSEEQVCDRQQGLLCSFKHGDTEGVCRGEKFLCVTLYAVKMLSVPNIPKTNTAKLLCFWYTYHRNCVYLFCTFLWQSDFVKTLYMYEYIKIMFLKLKDGLQKHNKTE